MKRMLERPLRTAHLPADAHGIKRAALGRRRAALGRRTASEDLI